MAGDPARQGGVTRKQMQDACKQEPCIPASKGKPGCVFCPHEKKGPQ